jgi:hypothetical protein
VATTSSATPSAFRISESSDRPAPTLRSRNTPPNAAGIDPSINHLTRSFCTVRRDQCTAPPIGFITIDATMSLDTAVSGSNAEQQHQDRCHQRSTTHSGETNDETDEGAAGDHQRVEHGSHYSPHDRPKEGAGPRI